MVSELLQSVPVTCEALLLLLPPPPLPSCASRAAAVRRRGTRGGSLPTALLPTALPK